MQDEHVYDLIPGYALGSLDEQELLQVARHLPHCAACRLEFESFAETVDGLAYAVPLVTPPAGLREKVINSVGSATAAQAAARSPITETREKAPMPARSAQPGIRDFFRSLFSSPFGLVASAAVVVLLVVFGVNTILLNQRVHDLQAAATTAPFQGQVRLVRLSGTENAPQASGYLMVFPQENYGTLAVENASVLDPGYQYQLWLIKDGKRTSGGVFSVSDNGYAVLEVDADQPLENYQSFGITIEPAGGSPQPTGSKVMGGSL